MKYALVQFQDGNRQVKYLALTKDIKGYQPSSSEDIPDREYLVKWQKSFKGEDGEYDDGCFNAKILIVGATPEEIRAKAKELKVRLPLTFPSSDEPESKPAMDKPLRKKRKKAGDEDHEVHSKLSRMNETLKFVKSSNSSKKTENISALQLGDDSANSVSCVNNQATTHCDEEKSKTVVTSDTSNMEKPIKEAAFASPIKNKAIHGKKSSADKKGSCSSESKESRKRHTLPNPEQTEFSTHEKKSSGDMKGSCSSESKNSSKLNSVPTLETEPNASTHERKSGGDMKGSHSSGNKQSRKLDTPSIPKKGTDTSRSKMGDGYSNLDSIKNLNETYESDISDCTSDDDATVLLEKLKKKHQLCDSKIENLQDKIIKLKNDLLVYKLEIEKKRVTIKCLKKEVESFKTRNLNLEQEIKLLKVAGASKLKEGKQAFGSPTPSTSSQLSYKYSSEAGNENQSPDKLSVSPLNYSPSPTFALNKSSTKIKFKGKIPMIKSSVKRSLFLDRSVKDDQVPLFVKREPSAVKSPFKEREESDELSDNLMAVTERIEEDLNGSKPLEGDDERVYVGMGTYINKKFWEKTIRGQRDDSKFVKDCAQAVWGLDKLKVRTVERKSKSRPVIATPEKVDLVYAMLRGKLKVRSLSDGEQNAVIANAKKWLGEKMYDVGRPAKKPKSA